VIELVVDLAMNGTLQKMTVGRIHPTRFCCENTITWRVPPNSTRIGDP